MPVRRATPLLTATSIFESLRLPFASKRVLIALLIWSSCLRDAAPASPPRRSAGRSRRSSRRRPCGPRSPRACFAASRSDHAEQRHDAVVGVDVDVEAGRVGVRDQAHLRRGRDPRVPRRGLLVAPSCRSRRRATALRPPACRGSGSRSRRGVRRDASGHFDRAIGVAQRLRLAARAARHLRSRISP